MSYVKAQAVFPKSLLDEIQKYVQGEMVYVPKSPACRKEWGSNTDTKNMIAQRNENIVQSFKAGISIVQLVEIYHLSDETIRKIVYKKQ